MTKKPVTNLRNNFPEVEKQVEEPSHRGYMHKYANPSLVQHEKNAGRIHAVNNYKKYMPEEST